MAGSHASEMETAATGMYDALIATSGSEDRLAALDRFVTASGGFVKSLDAVKAAFGTELAEEVGCVACHSTDSDGVGPSFAGLGDRSDAAYLSEAILDPDAFVVAGFSPGIMPVSYGDTITDAELEALVAYLLSL